MDIAIPLLDFGRSGGYRVLAELASQWTARQHHVTIFVPHFSERPYFPTTAEIIWLDDHGKARHKQQTEGRHIPRGGQRVYTALRALTSALNRYATEYTIVLANHSLTAWPVFLSRVHARKFYYIQAYEPEYFAGRPGLGRKLLRGIALASYRLPLVQVVNSPIYFRYPLIRAKDFVPPGIDFSVMYPKATREYRGKRSIRIGCIGRREPEKGTRYVVEAFLLMLQQGMDVELRVAYGNLPKGQEQLPRCEICTPENDRELGAFYRSLDILIAPGTVQLGAPHYPVMEAMACAVPVVTTGYLPANSDNAWIVPVHDSIAISRAVQEIIANPAMRAQRVKRALADVQAFGWEAAANRMLELFVRSDSVGARPSVFIRL